MPFADFETSAASGRPVELYVFSYEGGLMRFTSDAEDVFINPITYTAASIDRSEIEENADISKSDLTLTVPNGFLPSELFSVCPPSSVVGLQVFRVHRAELTSAALLWSGRVLSVNWKTGSVEMTCESVFTSMRRTGLRRLYSKNCPHVLYGARCGLAQLSFLATATIDIQTGTQITSSDFATFPDGYFSGGKIEWVDEVLNVTHRRGIRFHVSNAIYVTHPIPGITPASVVDIFPGCDHTLPTCLTKFNNTDNYGGFQEMQSKNPFGTNSVFY